MVLFISVPPSLTVPHVVQLLIQDVESELSQAEELAGIEELSAWVCTRDHSAQLHVLNGDSNE